MESVLQVDNLTNSSTWISAKLVKATWHDYEKWSLSHII